MTFEYASLALQHQQTMQRMTELERYIKQLTDHKNPSMKTNLIFIFETWEGKETFDTGNVITNIGENASLQAMFYGWSNNITKLAVGNATGTLQTKTTLDAVYDDPTDGNFTDPTISSAWMNSGDIARNMTYQWTFEETVRLDSIACYLHNTTYAYALANFPEGARTFDNGENLTGRWVMTFNCN